MWLCSRELVLDGGTGISQALIDVMATGRCKLYIYIPF